MSLTSSTFQMVLFGDAFASGGTWTNSDAKLKNNIAELESGILDKVLQLKPSSYTYKTDGEYSYLNLPETNQIGFIAQELKTVFPEFVKESEIADDDGETAISHDLHSVNYAAMVSVLTKAIQEQQVMIQAQQATIAEMKADIEALKNK